MGKRKKPIQEIVGVVILILVIILLFFRFSLKTGQRIEEQNKNYAADSAQLKSEQIDDELNNAMRQINTYAYFSGQSLKTPVITADMLKKMEENSYFDAIMYTDANGIDHASDGRTADVTARRFYTDGISGNSNIEIIFDPHFFDETMACFYAPVYFDS